MSMGIDLRHDLTFARVAGEQIDEYVHTEVLFFPVGAVAGLPMPQLTIGTWLEAAWRLQALAPGLRPDQQAALDQAQARVQRVRSRAPDLYTQKARREFKSRLDTWTWYLDDVLAGTPAGTPAHGPAPVSPGGQAYPTQVHVRFKLELLKGDVAQMHDQLARLETCDRRLCTRFTAGPFVWEPELASHAPPDTYWWLYGCPA